MARDPSGIVRRRCGWEALTVAECVGLPRGGLHTHLHDGTGRGLGKGVVGGEKFGVWLPALKAGEDLGRDPALKAGWARALTLLAFAL